MPNTTGVGSAAVATDMSWSCVHGPDGAAGGAVTGGGAGGGAEEAAGPHALPHAVFSSPVLLAHPMKQFAHAGAEPIMPITTGVGSAAVATDMSCSCVHGPSAANVKPIGDSIAYANRKDFPRAMRSTFVVQHRPTSC